MVLAIFELILLVFAAFSLGTILAHRENVRIGDGIEWPLPDARTAKIRILAVAQAVGEAKDTAA